MDSFLSRLAFLKGLSAADLARVSAAFILRRHAKGAVIFEEAGAADAVYLLKTGLVKTVKRSPKDEPVVLEIVVPGHLFGMMPALDKRPYPVDAVCLEDSEIYRIKSADCAELLRRHAPFAQAVFAEVGEHLRHSHALRSMVKEPAERRIAYILWMLSLNLGREMLLGREIVAEMAGTTVETAIRVLVRLRERGLIEARYKRIKVLKPDALRDGLF